MIGEAAAALRRGGIVGLPTDTVYGLAAIPTDERAVRRLYEVKQRPDDKPVALLVSSVESAAELVAFTESAAVLARRYWPGALTLVLPAVRRLPDWVGDTERGTVGVRMPDHALALELLEAVGPLAVTSANLSGQEPVLDHGACEQLFAGRVDLYLPGVCPGGPASTVIDATVEPVTVLRQGPIEIRA